MRNISSSELIEWAAEFKIRNEEEREAMKRAREPDEGEALDPLEPLELDADEIVREARARGHIE